MAMEETRRRNEASMARKRANPKAVNPAAANASANSLDDNGPLTPSSTGAMDSLLEKLRAAAPQARDQRDRRRRARLKDKHQVRIASGQTIPDIGDLTKKSNGEEGDDADDTLLAPSDSGAAGEKMEPISEGEDVAERAATMLQGLRDTSSGNGTVNGNEAENGGGGNHGNRPASREGGSGSLRVRRRRESADDERRNRRRRRARESVDEDGGGVGARPGTAGKEEVIAEGREEERDGDGVPRTMVSPPSPDGGAGKPIVVVDD